MYASNKQAALFHSKASPVSPAKAKESDKATEKTPGGFKALPEKAPAKKSPGKKVSTKHMVNALRNARSAATKEREAQERGGYGSHGMGSG